MIDFIIDILCIVAALIYVILPIDIFPGPIDDIIVVILVFKDYFDGLITEKKKKMTQ